MLFDFGLRLEGLCYELVLVCEVLAGAGLALIGYACWFGCPERDNGQAICVEIGICRLCSGHMK